MRIWQIWLSGLKYALFFKKCEFGKGGQFIKYAPVFKKCEFGKGGQFIKYAPVFKKCEFGKGGQFIKYALFFKKCKFDRQGMISPFGNNNIDLMPQFTTLMFKNPNLHKSSRILLNKIISIINEYEDMGYQLTVRQIYYQLVSRLIVENDDSMYKRTSKLVTQGRMLGEIEWESIVDRARIPKMPGQYKSMAQFVKTVKDVYRKHRWADQKHYVEVIVEKDALAGILEPVALKYHVSLLANRGYSSASALHDLYMRMVNYGDVQNKKCHILYLGDHDPSGLDMVRDMEDRLYRFCCGVKIERIALTMDQIKQYKPPPNPAKTSDPRSEKYRQQYCDESWELDALDPTVLVDLVEDNITKYLDINKYNKVLRSEQEERNLLDVAVAGM